MITEDYVSFEIAKFLKEKGFDEATFHEYSERGTRWFEEVLINHNSQGGIACPTLQMTMKWLREVHHVFIDIDYDPHEFGDKPYFTLITNMDTCSYYSGKHLPVNRATYEEMAEAAIKYCLENLI